MDAVTSASSLPGYLDATETASSVPVITATGFGDLPIYYSEAPASANLGSSIAAPEVQECPLRKWKHLYIGAATMAVLFLVRPAR